MNTQEIPLEAQEPLATEEHPRDAENLQPRNKPSLASTPQPNAQASPTPPPPFIPNFQPHPWTTYSPGTWQQPWRSRWPWIALTLVLLFVLLAGGAISLVSSLGNTFGGSITETRHFSVSAHPTLVVTNDVGSIQVRAGGTGLDMSIVATKHRGPWETLNDLRVNYAQDTQSNTVTITAERLNIVSFFGSANVDFTITVPSTTALQLKTNTGSIEVSGVSGQMVLTSNTGSVAASGGILDGKSMLVSNTGSITFTGSIGSSGTYLFQTNTGSVNVMLPSESAFHLDASTDTGSITTDFPGVTVQHHQVVGADAYSAVGNIPHATISLKTNTGSITLSQR